MNGLFVLIPVAEALPAVDTYLARYPDDSTPPSPEELRQLVELTYQFLATSGALLAFTRAVGARPSMR